MCAETGIYRVYRRVALLDGRQPIPSISDDRDVDWVVPGTLARRRLCT